MGSSTQIFNFVTQTFACKMHWNALKMPCFGASRVFNVSAETTETVVQCLVSSTIQGPYLNLALPVGGLNLTLRKP